MILFWPIAKWQIIISSWYYHWLPLALSHLTCWLDPVYIFASNMLFQRQVYSYSFFHKTFIQAFSIFYNSVVIKLAALVIVQFIMTLHSLFNYCWSMKLTAFLFMLKPNRYFIWQNPYSCILLYRSCWYPILIATACYYN